MPEQFSDELLNAYVDGELDGEDRDRIEQAMEQDAALRARVDELVGLKRLVTTSYADAVPRGPAVLPRGGRHSLPLTVAASIAAFMLGVAVTWGVLSYTGTSPVPRVAQGPGDRGGSAVEVERAVKVMFHLSRDNPERLQAILNEAEALLTTSRRMDESVSVRIIASGAGLSLFEQDAATEMLRRVSEMKQTYNDRLVFNGCGVAYKQLKSRSPNEQFTLIPAIELVDLGVLELMRRQRDGWAYIRL